MDKQYRSLTEKFTEDIFNNAAEQTNPVYVQQNKDQQQILNMVAKVLLSYTIVDSALSICGNDKKSLASKFNSVINDISKGQFNTEKDLVNNIIQTAAKDKYYTDAYISQLGFDFKLQKVTDAEIAKIVNNKVDGKLWSNRIWDNKKDLQDKLQTTIGNFLKGNINVNRVEREVKKKFNQNAYNTHRLVQSEIARCQDEANNVFAENHGVDEQMYTATLERNTCAECAALDGKVYSIDDVNKPAIPEHPLCRCCYVNLPSEDWRPKLRREQEDNKVIDWTTYQDWYDNNVEKFVNSDIINEKTVRSSEFKVNKSTLNSKEYANKFSNFGNNKLNNSVLKETKNVIKNNDKKNTESMSIINIEGKAISRQDTGPFGGNIDLSILENLDKDSVILTHNHPKSSSFSDNDIALLLNNSQIKTIIAGGHDGTVYKLSVGNGIRLGISNLTNENEVIKEYRRLLNALGDSNSVVDALVRKYNWDYEVV